MTRGSYDIRIGSSGLPWTEPPFQRGHRWKQNATPLMLIFPNEINKLVN